MGGDESAHQQTPSCGNPAVELKGLQQSRTSTDIRESRAEDMMAIIGWP
jgi:hypothetical protein